MVTFGQVKKAQFPLIETGEYVFTLNDIGETTGDYGDRLEWDFLVAEKDSPTEYLARNDGKERVLRFWTDTEITLGSKQHQWMQALMGRSFNEGDDLPDGNEVLGKRMVAYLTHYVPKKGKNAGVAREDIVAGSAKAFSLNGKKNGAAKQTPPPSNDADEHAALVADVKKQIRRALLADIEAAEDWKDVNLEEMTVQELRDGLALIKEMIAAAAEE